MAIRGYGEENDWCQRALAAGWQHLIATDVYVVHQGAVSFSSETAVRVRAAMAVLAAPATPGQPAAAYELQRLHGMGEGVYRECRAAPGAPQAHSRLQHHVGCRPVRE
jgi:hypothetical protein